MSCERNFKITDESDELSFKYESIDDFLNNKPTSLDAELAFDVNQAELVFNKPIFDMAFIITHNSLIPKISELQKHFQTKYGFTTHCIYLPEIAKLKFCIRDLKLHQISYAIVVFENSFVKNVMDIYVLYPNIEVQKCMNLSEIDNLVKEDSENFAQQIKTLRKNPDKNPHPVSEAGEEMFNMNDEFRYYFSLLSDNRMLTIDELKRIDRYLQYRKTHLENLLLSDNSIFDNRPLQACRQEQLKYYIYQPYGADMTAGASLSDKTKYLQNSGVVKPPVNIPAPLKAIKPASIPLPSRPAEVLTLLKAKTMSHSFITNLQRIPLTQSRKALSKQYSYTVVKDGVTIIESTKMPNPQVVEYPKTAYFRNQMDMTFTNYEYEEDIISLSSGSCTPPLDYELTPVTPPTPKHSPLKPELPAKRKTSESLETQSEKDKIIPAKVQVLEIPSVTVQQESSSIKNCPESLLNLFRLILNMAPLSLPHDNAILHILNNSCNDVQNGIMVPSLKNVKIDYESCKSNGVNEIITSIFGVYEATASRVEHIADMDYVWKKFFPDHLSNFSLLILFYRLVKLLILFKLFNSVKDCMNIVMCTLEKIDVIVNFDFKLPVFSDQNHLNCFPDMFPVLMEKSEELHTKYFNLSSTTELRLANNCKKLDAVIKQKKIEFILGPLLNYFVNVINSISQQLQLEQIKKIYHAVRTLRYCLREIYPINTTTTVFNDPRTFDTAVSQSHYKDISEELKTLLEEIKFYQCIVFTEKHYAFVNCLLDFAFVIEAAMDLHCDSFMPKSNTDSLIVIDPAQFINSFTTFECCVYQYHPDTEVEFLKNSLKDNWVHTLHSAFKGLSTDKKENRIIKEINNLLPVLWGLRTFDEAIIEAAKLYYNDWYNAAQHDPNGWYERFCKDRYAGIVWLNMFQLPYTKAVEELQKYENMLKNEFLSATPVS